MPTALSIGLCAFVYIFMMKKSVPGAFVTSLTVIILGAAVLAIAGETILTRFMSGSLSGRELLWRTVESVANQFPDFGIGLGHQILIIPEDISAKTGGTIAAHDEYLRLKLELGLVNSWIVVGLLMTICLKIWLSARVNFHLVFLAAAASFFIYCSTDNAISSALSPMVISLASFVFPAKERNAPAQPIRAYERSRRLRRLSAT